MIELVILIFVFIVLFWIGVKLNRWINGSSQIAKNQKKILEELKRETKIRQYLNIIFLQKIKNFLHIDKRFVDLNYDVEYCSFQIKHIWKLQQN